MDESVALRICWSQIFFINSLFGVLYLPVSIAPIIVDQKVSTKGYAKIKY